jgi:hypothetical protein
MQDAIEAVGWIEKRNNYLLLEDIALTTASNLHQVQTNSFND